MFFMAGEHFSYAIRELRMVAYMRAEAPEASPLTQLINNVEESHLLG